MNRNIFIFILLIFVSGCHNIQKIGNQNIAHVYNPEKINREIDFSVFHENDSFSLLFFKVQTDMLLPIRKSENEAFFVNFSINFLLFESYESKVLFDSATFYFTDYEFVEGKSIYSVIPLKAKFPNDYLLAITLTDFNHDKSSEFYIPIEKTDKVNRQNFSLLDSTNSVHPNSIVIADNFYRIKINDTKITELSVRYYYRDFPIALPPFTLTKHKPFDYQSDSTFTLKISDGKSEALSFSKLGFYHILIDSAQRQGLTLFNFGPNYPKVSTTSQMLQSLRYLTSRQEYQKMMDEPNPKKAIDNFWLENAGTSERAREMIRRYYKRVQFANSAFQSYHEGWKTDRGMIYIIYGPPNTVFRGTNSEQWIYGEPGNLLSISFYFVKINNPFTNNDFSLADKSPVYKESWYNAVETWRR